ncbi:MAG TPA: DUF5660 family protein [Patescibacteria group bacterium]|nr:DUF5660 family protein [Patescibacteria group bacterium]
MDQGQQKNRKPVLRDNFIENLRDFGSGFGHSIAQDVIEGLPSTALDQISQRKRSGTLQPNETLNLKRTQEQERIPYQYRRELNRIRQEERFVFKQSEQKTQLQIKAIQEELKRLALSTKELSKEVEIAATLEPVEPGIYHLNFLERLKRAIELFREKIEESANWLNLFNQRTKKRNYYWGQVRKSGTKFMLSQERYMATQAG